MSTYKNRTLDSGYAQFNGATFWTNQVFGHSINGVHSPSLNVSTSDTALLTDVTFSFVGDSGDEGGSFVSAKQQFIDFMTNPAVTDKANALITEKMGALMQLQLALFIEKETAHLPTRPRTTREATMQQLLGIATNAKPKL